MLNKFRLQVKTLSDKTTDSIRNIRWMTLKEKQTYLSEKEMKRMASNVSGDKSSDVDLQDSTQEGSLTEFLKSQCAVSVFDDDFILMSEFKLHYDQWCVSHGYTGIRKEPLDGELLPVVQFGSRFEAASRMQLLFYVQYFVDVSCVCVF